MNRRSLKVDEENLTFVVQGPSVELNGKDLTLRLFSSIREWFPLSRILFSTWKNPNPNYLEFLDKIVINSDPGAEYFLDYPATLNNVNRQIVSTYQGLKSVETQYAIKVRSDLIFYNRKILKALQIDEIEGRNPKWSFLQRNVLVSNQTSINPRLCTPIPFHLCDWIHAGQTKDLLEIWSIPLMPSTDFRYFSKISRPEHVFDPYLSRFHPEVYITKSFVQKYISLDFEHSYDASEENIELSEKIIANNFIIKSNLQLGLKSQKYNKPYSVFLKMYTHKDWRKLAMREGMTLNPFEFDLVSIVRPLLKFFKPYRVLADWFKSRKRARM